MILDRFRRAVLSVLVFPVGGVLAQQELARILMERRGGLRGVARSFAAAVVLISCLVIQQAPAQTTTRVSVASSGAEGNGHSQFAAISADGRFVAFSSYASNLVSGDTNGREDVFVHDRATGETSRVSVTTTGSLGRNDGRQPSISADGRFVAFHTSDFDVTFRGGTYLHDRETGTLECVIVFEDGVRITVFPSISADGRYIACKSFYPLVDSEVGIIDVLTGEITVIGEGFGTVSISADGRFVGFDAWPDARRFYHAVHVYDRSTGQIFLVSRNLAGELPNSHAQGASISADGRFVAFRSGASDLVPDDTAHADVFVYDRMTDTTARVSVTSAGVQANSHSGIPLSISGDGRFVAFLSSASNLVPDDTNGLDDLFVHDRSTGTTSRVSLDSAGVQRSGTQLAYGAAARLSADGRFVAFSSLESTLVPGDTNGRSDVFVRELRDPADCRAGTVNQGAGSRADVLRVNGSTGDARRVVRVAPRSPEFQVSLDAAPSGPIGPMGAPVARYVLWTWRHLPSNAVDLWARGQLLGCTVNPTPVRPLATPQPFRCRRGSVGPSVCGSVSAPGGAPSAAPWVLTLAQAPARGQFTLQGVIEDLGANNTVGFSVTNAVLVSIE
jgi:Tol biopolymer transport system component